MMRLSAITLASLALVAGSLAFHRAVPNACTLLTAQDATTLGGFAVTLDSNSAGGNCQYKRTGASPFNGDGVEVTVRGYSDGPSAHAAFPAWANPSGKPNPHIIYIPITGLGDEATLKHIVPPPGITAVDFRKGAVLVKIGVYPPASDSALTTAARTMMGRM